jgi:hypothetical protein
MARLTVEVTMSVEIDVSDDALNNDSIIEQAVSTVEDQLSIVFDRFADYNATSITATAQTLKIDNDLYDL